jgi:predicted DNA-binding protein
MPRPSRGNDTQVCIRLPSALLKRASKLASRLGPHGMNVYASDVLRIAITKGLDAIEADLRKKESP